MGVKLAAAVVVAALAASPVEYLQSRQQPGGGFAEPGGQPAPGLTAWAVLGLRASGVPESELERAGAYLEQATLEEVPDIALAALALESLGRTPTSLLERLEKAETPSGRIGPLVNSTAWAALAYRGAGRSIPARTVRYLLARQSRGGGWSWHPRGAPDSNDTAAVMQALRAAGVRGKPIARGLAFLRRHQNRDGGFELVEGRGSDAQSTAWAVQAFLAAGVPPGNPALRYLERMRRADGSFRYSARYTTTPVWVTAQAVTALAGRPLPLR